MSAVPDKWCASCGRRIEWRRKWADVWDQVRYCSDACRRHKPRPIDRQIEEKVLELLDARARGATICPSEVARMMFADDWSGRMEDVRRAVRRLVVAGEVVVTQGGTVVDASTAKGAIRVRRVG